MTLLSEQTITGDGTEKVIALPSVPSTEARIIYFFDGFTEDLEIRQGADGVAVRIPASDPQPFAYGPSRLLSAEDRIVVANADSVDITIKRVQ